MLPGGTDHTYREQAQDAIYGARAWAQGLAWSSILCGLGAILTGLAQHNTVLLATGVTAVVVAFVPRARPAWVYEVARTWAMKQGWTAVPAEERPLRTNVLDWSTGKTVTVDLRTGKPVPEEQKPIRTPDEILAKRVPIKPVAEVRRADEA